VKHEWVVDNAADFVKETKKQPSIYQDLAQSANDFARALGGAKIAAEQANESFGTFAARKNAEMLSQDAKATLKLC
jgi:hypothetical protein